MITPVVDLTDSTFVLEQPPAIPALHPDPDEPSSAHDAEPPEGEESESDVAGSQSTLEYLASRSS